MRAWLRLTLIAATVGGGFMGFVICLQAMIEAKNQPAAFYALMLAFSALYAFVTSSGLVFAHAPDRTRLLSFALAVQVPWVSSPLLAYRFAAGIMLSVGLFGGQPGFLVRLGSDIQVNFFQELPWGIGVNVAALALFVLVQQSVRPPATPPQRPAEVPEDPAPAESSEPPPRGSEGTPVPTGGDNPFLPTGGSIR